MKAKIMQWAFISVITLFILLLGYWGQKAAVADWGGKRVNWVDGLLRLLCKYIHRLDDRVQIAIPATGPAIVVANHVSGLDPFLLIAASQRPLRFLIAREEYDRPVLHWLFKASGCIPVDRSGKPEQALRQALRALQAGEVIALFPHGKIHLDHDPPRRIKGGVARLSAWSQTPVYPVRIDGVAGAGKVTLAPFMPSRVRLTLGDPVQCQTATLKADLAAISLAIELPSFQ